MSKKPNAQSGRVAYDERGQPVWEWRVDTGALQAAVSLPPAPQQESLRFKGFDPYSTAVAKEPPAPQETAKPKPPKTRHTLDDMRALSEEIKKNRQK